jgi:sugar O-acyltransferase (sialic acid O-acetyltransferase NeuD family)
MSQADIVIVGYGGLAKEIAQYIQDANAVSDAWRFLGFCAEHSSDVGLRIGANQIVMSDDDLLTIDKPLSVVIGSGFPSVIHSIFMKLEVNSNLSFPNIIHTRAYTGSEIDPGSGNIICPGVVLSVDVEAGSHNLFNWNCTIGHDSIIGSFNVFNPSCNVSGSTKIGSRVLVGTGAQVLQGLSICDDVVIGAGAVVTKDITEPGVYVGMPARRIK